MTINHSEKLCLKWHDFQYNTTDTFRSLRSEPDFTDITLISEDNQKIKAHRVILARSSPIIQSMLDEIEHSHPLIYMRGIKFKDLSYLVDFIYHGETSIDQEHLQSFMGIAHEFKVKGLENTKLPEELEQGFNSLTPQPKKQYKSKLKKYQGMDSFDSIDFNVPVKVEPEKYFMVTENIPFNSEDKTVIQTDSQISELKKKIEAMIEVKERGLTCKACGHEADKKKKIGLVSHIEISHMNVGFPCIQCSNSKLYNSSRFLYKHIAYKHNNGAFK